MSRDKKNPRESGRSRGDDAGRYAPRKYVLLPAQGMPETLSEKEESPSTEVLSRRQPIPDSHWLYQLARIN